MRSSKEVQQSLLLSRQHRINYECFVKEYDYLEESSESEEECERFEVYKKSNEESEKEVQSTSSASSSYIYGRNKYKWSLNPHEIQQEKLCNHLPGPKHEAANIRNPLAAWSLLFTDKMLQNVVLHTNNQIQILTQNLEKASFYSETDVIEMKAFIGLLYFIGINKQFDINSELWYNKFGCNFYMTVMPYKRFKFLINNIRFYDDRETRDQTAVNEFASIRELWSDFMKNCYKYYTMSDKTARSMSRNWNYSIVVKLKST